MLLLALMQAAQPLPAIELNLRVQAERVTVERRGEATLTVRAEPDGGSDVVTVKSPGPQGAKTYRNVRIETRAKAVIADPQQAPENGQPEEETPRPDAR